jgi:hypothetical protein
MDPKVEDHDQTLAGHRHLIEGALSGNDWVASTATRRRLNPT